MSMEQLFVTDGNRKFRQTDVKKHFYWNTAAKVGIPLDVVKFSDRYEITSGGIYKLFKGEFKIVHYFARTMYGTRVYRNMVVPDLDNVVISDEYTELYFNGKKLDMPQAELAFLAETMIGDNYARQS